MTGFKIGIIGGSGFYDLEELTEAQEVTVETEFGIPSDNLVTGKIDGVDCVVLARHGKGHKINPSEVNYRANIRAMEKLGVTHILASTACGSLRENYKPGDFVILDSFIDRTTKRAQTFHDQASGPNFGRVCHIPMSPAFCDASREIVVATGKKLGLTIHESGTMVTIEGPRFSSKAESLMFQQWGGHVINMTTVPEVVLAAEAGLSYVSVAMVTDYDCWRPHSEAVSVEAVMVVLKENVHNVKKLFMETVKNMGAADWNEVIQKNKAKAKGGVMG
ncbi:S-methyl-5'-thioadenosine phosphorylase-like [Tigriopus californicus]|uniref:S-methyl-5'-thioadenosine phosphorylase-like n=1 Tax=Tigriopus californicus TaxID=6832 RepID=UPI0027D9DD04|nr:S-methyl-5'-thioadenosine phosphorylase-like [Tigriopus californicus]